MKERTTTQTLLERYPLELLLAFATYMAASAADYLLTVSGLAAREIRELNPLLEACICSFGAERGLLAAKVFISLTAILGSTLYLHTMYRKQKVRIHVKWLLYAGAVFTALAPLHYVLRREWLALLG